MKHLHPVHVKVALLLLLLLPAFCTQAQIPRTRVSGPVYGLGPSAEFTRQLQLPAARGGSAPSLALRVSAAETFKGQVNTHTGGPGRSECWAGRVQGAPGASFLLYSDGSRVEGHILLPATKQAYRYSTSSKGQVTVQAVDINSVICVDYPAPRAAKPVPNGRGAARTTAVPLLQSYPGARGCLLLDFDGEVVTSRSWTPYNNGQPINAAPSGLSNELIQEMWELVSEDFLPFGLNVTTDEAVYNSYPYTLRQRCIVTPTDIVRPGVGGIAMLGSFATKFHSTDDAPCWAFVRSTTGVTVIGDAASHEFGHTLGLGHDGSSNPATEYYSGGIWGPIMGHAGRVGQWSKGEYPSANNLEDDLAIIAGPKNDVGYRPDDHGNTLAEATALSTTGSTLTGSGIIERNTDQDYFKFTTTGGSLSLRVNPAPHDGNLDISVRLLNSSGRVVGAYDAPGSGNLAVAATATLDAGTYYLQIDGTGSGSSPDTRGEYSDYGSLGGYTIGITSEVPVAGLYSSRNYAGAPISLPLGKYSLAALQSRGYLNKTLESLTVTSGFQVVLFAGDNFSGDSLVVKTSQPSLANTNPRFDRYATSLKVRPEIVTAVTVVTNCDLTPRSQFPLPPGSYSRPSRR